jgi:inorganic pyrophosphatase
MDSNNLNKIQVFIEVEADSCERKRFDEKTLAYISTHCVPRPYPYPYGFIIGTRSPDGGAVDCYVITPDPLEAGSIVQCEPVGLLKQDEDGELDDKVLAAFPGQDVSIDDRLLETLRDFIQAIFASNPDVSVQVGGILPRSAAQDHIRNYRDAEANL